MLRDAADRLAEHYSNVDAMRDVLERAGTGMAVHTLPLMGTAFELWHGCLTRILSPTPELLRRAEAADGQALLARLRAVVEEDVAPPPPVNPIVAALEALREYEPEHQPPISLDALVRTEDAPDTVELQRSVARAVARGMDYAARAELVTGGRSALTLGDVELALHRAKRWKELRALRPVVDAVMSSAGSATGELHVIPKDATRLADLFRKRQRRVIGRYAIVPVIALAAAGAAVLAIRRPPAYLVSIPGQDGEYLKLYEGEVADRAQCVVGSIEEACAMTAACVELADGAFAGLPSRGLYAGRDAKVNVVAGAAEPLRCPDYRWSKAPRGVHLSMEGKWQDCGSIQCGPQAQGKVECTVSFAGCWPR